MENGFPKNINNDDLRITNLSEGKKFDHAKLTNKVEQLGTGELKLLFEMKQYEIEKCDEKQTKLEVLKRNC